MNCQAVSFSNSFSTSWSGSRELSIHTETGLPNAFVSYVKSQHRSLKQFWDGLDAERGGRPGALPDSGWFRQRRAEAGDAVVFALRQCADSCRRKWEPLIPGAHTQGVPETGLNSSRLLLLAEGLLNPDSPGLRFFTYDAGFPSIRCPYPDILLTLEKILLRSFRPLSIQELHLLMLWTNAPPPRVDQFYTALLNQRQILLKRSERGIRASLLQPGTGRQALDRSTAAEAGGAYISPGLRKAAFRKKIQGLFPLGPKSLGSLDDLPPHLTEAKRAACCDICAELLSSQASPGIEISVKQLLFLLPETLQTDLEHNPYLLDALLLADPLNRFEPADRKRFIRFHKPASCPKPALPPRKETQHLLQTLNQLFAQDRMEELQEKLEGFLETMAASPAQADSVHKHTPSLLPNPYRAGTATHAVFEQLRSHPASPEEFLNGQAPCGFTPSQWLRAFYVVTSPREEPERGDARGHYSAKGHLYFARRDKEGRFSLHAREEKIPPRRRGNPKAAVILKLL